MVFMTFKKLDGEQTVFVGTTVEDVLADAPNFEVDLSTQEEISPEEAYNLKPNYYLNGITAVESGTKSYWLG